MKFILTRACVSAYIYIYIYIEREREREKEATFVFEVCNGTPLE